MAKEVVTIPITEVLDDMGIKWWKGSEEEVKHTLKRLDKAFEKVEFFDNELSLQYNNSVEVEMPISNTSEAIIKMYYNMVDMTTEKPFNTLELRTFSMLNKATEKVSDQTENNTFMNTETEKEFHSEMTIDDDSINEEQRYTFEQVKVA